MKRKELYYFLSLFLQENSTNGKVCKGVKKETYRVAGAEACGVVEGLGSVGMRGGAEWRMRGAIGLRIVVVLGLLLGFGVFGVELRGQESLKEMYGIDYYSVLFWNVENFFDTRPNPYSEDGDFTPSGEMRWSRQRFIRKRDGIAKSIIAAAGFPTIIAFAEIENRYVLNQILYETPLYMGDYRIIHKDSPDRRGIDVGLLYRKNQFRPLNYQTLNASIKHDLHEKDNLTRDILYVKGVLHELDTLHIFVNHWPSKFGGDRVSTPKRAYVASVLMQVCDSILNKNYRANILVMGDFNETPGAKLFEMLKNLNYLYSQECITKGLITAGTIKYQGSWEKIDHFFVSNNLLDTLEPISVTDSSALIFCQEYLVERDNAYTGVKPRRTYVGPRYNGGLSDHLPIILKIMRNW